MKTVTKVEFSQDEINTMIATLRCLSALIDETNIPSDLALTASNAFHDLSKVLCTDPMGEHAFCYEKL